jgi:hypothetical protein
MRTDILFAGIALWWTQEYAWSYASKLKEMGFDARVAYQPENGYIIAYSHKSFSVDDMAARLDLLFKKKE